MKMKESDLQTKLNRKEANNVEAKWQRVSNGIEEVVEKLIEVNRGRNQNPWFNDGCRRAVGAMASKTN